MHYSSGSRGTSLAGSYFQNFHAPSRPDPTKSWSERKWQGCGPRPPWYWAAPTSKATAAPVLTTSRVRISAFSKTNTALHNRRHIPIHINDGVRGSEDSYDTDPHELAPLHIRDINAQLVELLPLDKSIRLEMALWSLETAGSPLQVYTICPLSCMNACSECLDCSTENTGNTNKRR
jgi:hypothetical protein